MKRVVTSIILIPVITWVVLFAPQAVFAAAVCAFAALCWMEFAGIAAHFGARFTTQAGWIPGLAFLLIQRDESLLLIAIVLAALLRSSITARAKCFRSASNSDRDSGSASE